MLTHSVFFSLIEKDNSAVEALVSACHKYLAPHDGIVFFAACPRETSHDRDVVDQEFDVALTVVFENKEAHDYYQTTPSHMKFIDEQKNNWSNVRVFDGQSIGVEKFKGK